MNMIDINKKTNPIELNKNGTNSFFPPNVLAVDKIMNLDPPKLLASYPIFHKFFFSL